MPNLNVDEIRRSPMAYQDARRRGWKLMLTGQWHGRTVVALTEIALSNEPQRILVGDVPANAARFTNMWPSSNEDGRYIMVYEAEGFWDVLIEDGTSTMLWFAQRSVQVIDMRILGL
jgi:hypothetical protein